MKNKIENIMFDIYREMYLKATPSANFDEIDKVEDFFLSYFLSAEKQDEILNKHLEGKRLTKLMQNSVRMNIHLGMSPNTNSNYGK